MQQGIKSVEGISAENEDQWGLALQLLISHMLVAGITMGLFIWLSLVGLSNTLVLGIILLCGSSLGLLLTWNVRYTLCLLCTTLGHLSRGMPITLSEKKVWWHWPFTESFASLTDLDRLIKQQVEQIQLSRQYRAQLLQQASHEADLEQRHRLARQLDEKVNQRIFSIRLSTAIIQAQSDYSHRLDESMQVAIEDIQRNAELMQSEMQALRQQLHAAPLDHESLTTALQALIDTLSYQTGAALHITLGELPDADRLPRSMQELIFRIVQEACDNIARHAYPQHIWFTLEQRDQTLRLKIRDDGQGFDLSQVSQGTGLAHMHERIAELKGTISLQSQSGQGTSIYVLIPLLRTLPEQLDQQHQEWKIRHNFVRVRAYIQIGEWSALAALIFIALYDRFGTIHENRLCFALTLLFSLCSSSYGYLHAHRILSQIALTSGDHVEEIQALRLRLRAWHLWKYRLALAGIGYLVSLLHGWRDERIVLEFAAASCGILILLIREHGSELYAKRRLYAQLAQAEMRWEMQRWQQNLACQSKGWLLSLVCYLLLLPALNLTIQPPGRALQIFNDAPAIVIVILLWGAQLLLETLISRQVSASLTESKIYQAQLHATSKGANYEP